MKGVEVGWGGVEKCPPVWGVPMRIALDLLPFNCSGERQVWVGEVWR